MNETDKQLQELNEAEERLQDLFRIYEGNRELYLKLKDYYVESFHQIAQGYVFTKDHPEKAINFMMLNFIEEYVFSPLNTVHVFIDQPFKCVAWLKNHLKRFREIEEANFYKSLLLDGLNDNRRFNEPSNQLDSIIELLDSYDCKNLERETPITCGSFKHFTGSEVYTGDGKKLLYAFFSIQGYKKSSKQEMLIAKINEVKREALELSFEGGSPSKNINKWLNDFPDKKDLTGEPKKTKDVIDEHFKALDKKGWEYAFKTESDYKIFTNLLVDLFKGNDYDLPNEIIQLQNRCKTRLAATLREIHRELSNCHTLKNDDKFYKILKVLSPYENLPLKDLYRSLTR